MPAVKKSDRSFTNCNIRLPLYYFDLYWRSVRFVYTLEVNKKELEKLFFYLLISLFLYEIPDLQGRGTDCVRLFP